MLTHRISSAWALALVLSTAACASGGAARSTSAHSGDDASAGSMAGGQPARRTNVLTEDEIMRSHQANAYDVISSLRPRWFQTRGIDSFTQPSQIQVYLGSTRVNGGIESLREMASLGITRMEYVDPIAASSRWGMDHAAGAIVVSLSQKH